MDQLILKYTPYLEKYIFILGIFILTVGIVEYTIPEKIFTLWRRWVSSRYFFIYGIILILAGFPLTVYKGPLSTVIFVIGVFIAFTGPFILFFPEKLQNTFDKMSNEVEVKKLRQMIYFDAAMRVIAGVILSLSHFL